MNIFLTVQNNYHHVQLGLFEGDYLIAEQSISKKEASKLLIPQLAKLLTQQKLSHADLQFIVVNQGPAPFTTLRVIIASINGISYATTIPLIGIDAFDAMHAEWHNNSYLTNIILFNAFAGDVYFAIEQSGKPIKKGYQQIDTLLAQCSTLLGTIRFIGNGTALYREKIQKQLGIDAYITDPLPDYCSIETVASLGLQQWKKGRTGTFHLLPLYLKKHPAELSFVSSSPRY